MEGSQRAFLRAALAAGVLVGAACGGGGGGGGGPTAPQASITFAPAGAAGANSISLSGQGSAGGTRLILEVRANQVAGVYGLAFDLRYPAAVLRYETASEGPFLAGGGVPTSLQVAESPGGNLIVGLSRLGNVGGTGGSGLLLSLEFATVAGGSGSFTFADNAAFDAGGDPIPGIEWVAGSIQVVR